MKTKTVLLIFFILAGILGANQALADFCRVDQIVTGIYKGGLFRGKVIEVNKLLCKVKWLDGSGDPDEWIGPEQMLIQGYYKGNWYNGKILSKEGEGLYKVRWTDGSSDPDELVEIKNIRPR